MGQARVEPGLRTGHPTACCALAPPPRLPGKAARRAGAWPARRGRGPARPRPPSWLLAGYRAGRDGGARARRFGGAEEPPPPVGGAACRYGQGAVPGHETTNSRAPLPAPGPASPPGAESPRPWGTQVTPARKSRGRPRSAEEASPEAAQAGAGARGRPDLSRPAPSPGMRAGAARSPSALRLLAALRPGVGAGRRTPASPLPRRGAGRRGTLIPRPASARTSPGGPRAGNRDTPEGQRT